MSEKHRIPRTSSPTRHCACKNVLLQTLIPALETSPETAVVAKSLHKLASASMPGCPGTPIPEVNWNAVAQATAGVAEKILREGLKDWISDPEVPMDGDELVELLKSEGLLDKLGASTAGGIAQLWEVLLKGKAPAQSIIVH